MKKALTLLLALLMLLSCMAGCGSTPAAAPETTASPSDSQTSAAADPTAEPEPAAAEPQLAGEQVLTVAAGRCYWETDAANGIHKNTNVWEGLTTQTEELRVKYVLAKSMTVSDDGLTWTVELVDNAVFHDGTPFNAEVAIQNLDRTYHFNEKYDPEYRNTANFGYIESMEPTGEYSFVIHFEKPCYDFDYKISYNYSLMLSPNSWDENGIVTTPYGTGPFKFESYDENTQDLVVVANENYRDGAPTLQKIIFKTITDADTRLNALLSGEVDAIVDTGALIPAQVGNLTDREGIVVDSTPITITLYAYMNTTENSVLSDPVLREAVSLCIDTKSICNDLLYGYGIPGTSVITPVATQWSKDEGYIYDPEAAKALVEEKYGADGVTIRMVLGSSSNRWPFNDVAVVMQSALAQAGITMEIETYDNSTRGAMLKAYDFDITIMQHSLSTGEPNFFFANHMASTGSQTKVRGTGINDPHIDELCEQASQVADYETKKAIYDELQDIAHDQYLIIPIWHEVSAYAYKDTVQGLKMDPIFWTDYSKVSLLAE